MLDCLFAEFLYRAYPYLSKLSVSLKIERRFCLAGCHVVAQTQGYHLVCIGVAWLISRGGGGVVVKFDVFSHCYAVCSCGLHASNDPLCR